MWHRFTTSLTTQRVVFYVTRASIYANQPHYLTDQKSGALELIATTSVRTALSKRRRPVNSTTGTGRLTVPRLPRLRCHKQTVNRARIGRPRPQSGWAAGVAESTPGWPQVSTQTHTQRAARVIRRGGMRLGGGGAD